MNLYRNESSDPKSNAQLNLEGRTHYVDSETLKYHNSRINTTAITDGGLLFALTESYSLDYQNTNRAFRPVIFDVFGTVIVRPKLEEGFKTSKQAIKSMWAELNNIDAIAITEIAMGDHLKSVKRELQYLSDDIAKIKEVA